ncbi:MAG: hypothetical protein K6T16_01560 [Candidatus Pacearchaeota archaeon]|nr:hypothetical protein [Candidatus Pacearchaeota archaeon]
MAYEEVMLLNANRRQRKRPRRLKYPRRRYYTINAPRRRRFFGGGGGVLGTGVTVSDFIGAGAGGLASAVIPKLIQVTRYGWLNVLGSGVVAIGGSALIKRTKIADTRFANSFMIGGLTITAIKLLNQLGVFGKSGLGELDEEFEWEDVGAIAPATKVEGFGEEEEEEIVL